MARPLRIEHVDGWYHVTGRGNERRAIFRDDRDRARFLELLAAMTERFGVRLCAFALMENHYHLLLQLRATHLSRALADGAKLPHYGAAAMAIKRDRAEVARDPSESARLHQITQMLNVKM